MIRNLYLDGTDNSKLDFWLDGKRVTQMYLDGVCVWDVSSETNFVLTCENAYGGVYNVALNCAFGKDVTINWSTNIGSKDIETVKDGTQVSHAMVWLQDGVPVQYHTFKVYIDDDVTVIPEDFVQSGKGYITGVQLPSTIQTIKDMAFYNCSNLAIINFPKNLQAIGDRAYMECNLTTVTLPDTVTTIGQYAFYGNKNLSHVTFGGNIKKIGKNALQHCLLKTLTLSAAEISESAFENNPLESITIDAESIGSRAFANNDKVATCTLSSNTKKIGVSILDDNLNLPYITYNGTIDQWNKILFAGCPFWGNVTERYIQCSDGTITLPDVCTRQENKWKY